MHTTRVVRKRLREGARARTCRETLSLRAVARTYL